MYLDLTHTFNKNMPVFPGDPASELVRVAEVAKDGFMDHKVSTTMHVGTHVDAPAHMLTGGKFLDEYPISKFFGRGVVLDARGKKSAEKEILSGTQISKGDIVFICFGWSSEFGKDEYYENYPEISKDLAENLVELGVSIIGLDIPSPDRAPYVVHKILFKGDILIIENLKDLEQLVGKNFEVVALPVKFSADAAPIRVIAKI